MLRKMREYSRVAGAELGIARVRSVEEMAAACEEVYALLEASIYAVELMQMYILQEQLNQKL